MFEPGMLVDCINDTGRQHYLTKGRVYTITEFYPKGSMAKTGIAADDGVYLRCVGGGHFACRFRPLPDERLDVFRKALEPAPEKVAVYEIEAEMLRLEDAVEQSLQAIDRLGVGSA